MSTEAGTSGNTTFSRAREWVAGVSSRTWLVTGAVLVVLLLGWRWLPGTRDAAADSNRPIPVTVDAVIVTRHDFPMYLDGLGTVQAFNTVTVTARVDGALQKIGFVEGQTVNEGDLLAQIDPRPYQAALAQAQAARAKDEAQLKGARADLERYTVLAPENLASKQTLDSQRALVAGLAAQIKGDEASIENAQTQLRYATITSPIQGRTGIRRVDVGNNVHAADTSGIVVVTQMQPIALIFTLPEDALDTVGDALKSGPVSVAAVSRDGSKELDHGAITLIDNQIDQTTGTIRLKAVFPNEQNRLWPGQYLTARALIRTDKSVLTIPSAAVQRGPDGVFAYVVKSDSTVEVRPLKVGEEGSGQMVVWDGIREGERVVTSNQYRLQPGAAVRLHTAASASAGNNAPPQRAAPSHTNAAAAGSVR